MVPPVDANASLSTGSRVGLQTRALHCWVGDVAAIKHAAQVEVLRIDKWMARLEDTAKEISSWIVPNVRLVLQLVAPGS